MNNPKTLHHLCEESKVKRSGRVRPRCSNEEEELSSFLYNLKLYFLITERVAWAYVYMQNVLQRQQSSFKGKELNK